YDPVGIHAGSLLVLPSIELREGYSDNVVGTPGPKESGLFTEIEGAVAAQSNWSRHSLEGSLRGTYTFFESSNADDELYLNGEATAIIELRRDTTATLSTTVIIEDDSGATDHEYDFNGILSHRFNRVTASIRGSLDLFEFSERTATTGSVTRDAVADYQSREVALRLGYEISPAITVFSEAALNTRRFNTPIDSNGFLRGSDGYALSIGTDINLGAFLRGSVSVGHQVQKPDDPRFEDISGLIYDAELTWSITPLTSIMLRAGTSFDETISAGSSGSIRRTVGISVSHALRQNLLVTASLNGSRNEFEGSTLTEDELSATFGLEYLLNRNLALTAEYNYYAFGSTTGGADYTVNSVMVGLRLQR
ncbi:MAG: outer membrane beta-barrel protein, partial [Fimbriimonadaceae bacterium]|nr:outer membrane beta-barrel protein [Alphaproteobacteria bacterium]